MRRLDPWISAITPARWPASIAIRLSSLARYPQGWAILRKHALAVETASHWAHHTMHRDKCISVVEVPYLREEGSTRVKRKHKILLRGKVRIAIMAYRYV